MKIVLFLVFLVFLCINYRHLNLGFLSIYSIDEYAFHGSLLAMYEGLVSLDIRKLFSFGFYSYGFGFFALNLLVTAPFFAVDNIEMTIYIPRLLTSIFAIGSLYFIYKTAREYLDNTSSILISLIIVSMAGFWRNAFWFHPDWMMTFFIVLTVYFLSKDAWNFKKYFWYGCIAFGIALATKIQAITFIPFLFLYIFYDNLQHKNFTKLFSRLKLFSKGLSLSVLIFVFINPYLIHPTGLKAFISSFVTNMESNATNHGLDVNVTIMDKINNAIDYYYTDMSIFVLLVVIALFSSLAIFQKGKSKNLVNLVAIYFLINIAYLFLNVNKDWQHYYLTLFAVAPLLVIPLLIKYKKIKYYILGAILIIQVLTHLQEYKVVFTQGYHPEKEISFDEINKISNSLISDIKPIINQSSNILIEAYVPFDYQTLNLQYKNVHIIYGPISQNMFELEAFLEKSNSKDPSKFKEKDLIILPKNSIYFDKDKLKTRVDQDGFTNALKIIENFNNSGDLGYEKFKENEYFYIWRKK